MSTDHVFRPLNIVEKLAKEIGAEITYAYDDLVFIGHSEVLLQFDDDDDGSLLLFINTAVANDIQASLLKRWLEIAQSQNVSLKYRGLFSMDQKEGSEEISLRFS